MSWGFMDVADLDMTTKDCNSHLAVAILGS